MLTMKEKTLNTKWLSMAQAAEYLGVHINTIRKMIDDGLPYKAVGKRKLLHTDELDLFNNRSES